jgi:hypothetical protein
MSVVNQFLGQTREQKSGTDTFGGGGKNGQVQEK